jgi:hypothetical protein
MSVNSLPGVTVARPAYSGNGNAERRRLVGVMDLQLKLGSWLDWSLRLLIG